MQKRNTIQKEMVIEAVQSLKNHATADEVYEFIAKSHPSIGKGTVYRNLNSLAEDKEIKKIEIPNAADRFDHNCSDHFHIRCISCGAVCDVDVEAMPDLKMSVRDACGMRVLEYDILFKGICMACQGKGASED